MMATEVVFSIGTEAGELAVVRTSGNALMMFTPRHDEPDPVGQGYGTLVMPLGVDAAVQLGRALLGEFAKPARGRGRANSVVEQVPAAALAAGGTPVETA
jgi:hypothetical protein